MKQTTVMSRAVKALEKIYNSCSQDFWGGELPPVIITVQSKPGSMGHSSRAKIWKRETAGEGETDLYEINVAAEVLNYPIEETIDTILHEQTHIFCRVKGISETSNNGYYHNATFKEIAEAHGLHCVYTGRRYGWNTVPGDNLVEYALEKGWSEIQISRSTMQPIRVGAAGTGHQGTKAPGTKAPTSTRKVQCPKCGQSVRATKKVNILCGDCMEPMVEV